MSPRTKLFGSAALALGALTPSALRPPLRREAPTVHVSGMAARAPSSAVPEAPVAVPDLARLTPREAWTWVRDNSTRYTPAEEISLVAVFFRHLAASDPAAVLAFANESLARADGATIAAAAVDALIENGQLRLAQRQVEQWAAAPVPPAVGASYLSVAWQLARESDRGAADWLLALPGSPDRDAAFAGIARSWADHDPDAALAWTAALPAGVARATAMAHAFRVWADHDAAAAAQWLSEHEAAPEADRLIAIWISAAPPAQENSKLASHWAALIREPDLRERRQ